jgi:hypothetical protein
VSNEVRVLYLNPGSHNIRVNWKKPNENTYCVTQYAIIWVNLLNGNNESSIVTSEEDSFVIGNLADCVEYEVSVRAVNDKNESSVAVSGSTTTHTVGKYQIFCSVFDICVNERKIYFDMVFDSMEFKFLKLLLGT